jgi:hypothetical protein
MEERRKPSQMISTVMIEEEPSNPLYAMFHPTESKAFAESKPATGANGRPVSLPNVEGTSGDRR